MIETDYDKRQKAVLRAEAERDERVLGVFKQRNAVVISGRKTLAEEGWDAQYVVEYDGRRLTIMDKATIPLNELAASIEKQLT
ncbi:MAG TPA: hypothetical protein VKZ53_27865 [Candidatus Angelobacter sp.]|nr:hypothetical protein [Candidatus Angelobacter sp.]